MLIKNIVTSLLLQTLCLGTSFAALQSATPAVAATSKIIVIVNKEPISQSDLDDRINLVSLMSGMAQKGKVSESIRRQVLQSLIHEKIQIHAAAAKKVLISDAEVEQAIEGMAKDNGMKKEQFLSILSTNGIPESTLSSRIKAQLSWVKYIRQYFAPLVQVGENEIDATLAKMEYSKNQTQYNIAEIILLVGSPSQEKSVLNDANKIVSDLRAGANFTAIAQQISKGTNATSSGELGWVSPNQVDPAVASVLKNLSPGSISNPIRTTSGYKILKVSDVRHPGEADPAESEITFCQAFFPLSPSSTQEEYMEVAPKIEQTVEVKGCENFKKTLKEFGLSYQESPNVKMGNLPEQLRRLLKKAPVGKCVEPIMTENGLLVQMVCNKKDAEFKLPSRDQIKADLEQTKFSKQAARELQRLLSTAYMEFKDQSYSDVLK